MKPTISLSVLVVLCGAVLSTNAQVNVTQYHNHISRDGLYIDSAFTPSAAENLTRDLNFDGTIVGNVYAQPLYIEAGPGGRAMIIAVTESNNVYALDAVDGTIIWQRNVGAPVPAADLYPCTNVGSMGIIGTPVVDLASRALFLNAMVDITPDRSSATIKHYIISLNVDTGTINSGWPVDVEATAQYNGTTFTAAIQQQRPALGIVGNILYVGYGSMSDCTPYHGWLVGVPISNPHSVTAWATSAIGGAIWGVGGVASDGTSPFVTTGNTIGTGGNWSGGEAVIRFQAGPIFSPNSSNCWAPTNWLQLDNDDADLGSSSPLLVDVPGATPSHLVVAMGKDQHAYLLNRDNLGGIGAAPIASAQESFSGEIIQAAATYRTNQGTHVALRASGASLQTFRITAASPPTIASGWSVSRNGCGSPFVTSTDGTNNMIVWTVGTTDDIHSGDQRLHGYDGDTGAVVYGGGGAKELMAGTHSYSTTGIAAQGRIYVATDNKVYAFRLVGTTDCGPSPNTDIDHNGKPDYLLYASTGRTAVWYMNNNVFAGSAFGPTLPAGWNVIDVANFNSDSNLDYALFNPNTRQTAIWYLSGVTFVSGAFGPSLPSGWTLVAVGDFDADCKPDYVLYNASTRRTAIWYMNNNVFVSGAFGPTLPAGWSLAGVADFNGDGKRDYLLFNSTTRQSAIWYLSGVTFVSGAYGPTLPSGWQLMGNADFNGDGKPDYLLYNPSTRQTAIWYMNNNVFVSGAYGPSLPAGWNLVAP